MQIDFTGVHSLTDTVIFGEGKGYKKKSKVNNDTVLAFKGKAEIYKKKKGIESLIPIFITTSDFTWEISELINETDFLKELLAINGNNLIERLLTSKYIKSFDYIDFKIKEKVPLNFGDKNILIFNGNLFWLQKFKNELEEQKYYAIFDKEGEIIKQYEAIQILELLPNDIKELSYINLDIQIKIFEYLILNNELHLENLVDELGINYDSIKVNLDIINIQEKIIEQVSSNKLILSKEIECFRKFFQILHKIKDEILLVKFYLSDYYKEMINDRMINYLLNRFFISNLNNQQKNEFKITISLFPSVLDYCFIGDTKLYEGIYNTYEKFLKKISKNCDDILYKFLKQDFYFKILEDYFKKPYIIQEIFRKNNITDMGLFGNLVLLNKFDCILDFNSKNIVMFRKYVGKEPLRSGLAVAPTDKGQFVNSIVKLIALKDYIGAIEKCDQLLLETSLEEYKCEFLINKGTANTYLGKFSEAIKNYNEALVYKQKLPTTYGNLARAWFNKYLQAIDNQSEFPVITIKLLEYLIKAKEFYNQFKKQKLKKEDESKFEKFKSLEAEINNELKGFYNQCLNESTDLQVLTLLFQIKRYHEEHLKPIYEIHKERIDSIADKPDYHFTSVDWNELSIIYMILGENHKALELIDNSLIISNRDPNYFAFLDTKGEINYKLGELEDSYDLFSKILRVNKDDIRVKSFYAETCYKAAKAAGMLGLKEDYEKLSRNALKLVDNYCKNEKVKFKIKNEFS